MLRSLFQIPLQRKILSFLSSPSIPISSFLSRPFSSSERPPSEFHKNLFESEVEVLTPEQQKQKEELIKELTKRLAGPLADANGNVPQGNDRPTAIEVDGPSHFYANSTKYTAYTKLKHRLLTRMGYRVLHVPYFEWRKLRGAKEREEYMKLKLQEQPTEWLDPQDEVYYNQRVEYIQRLQADVSAANSNANKANESTDANKANETKDANNANETAGQQ